jgi:PAS domain-containing protein
VHGSSLAAGSRLAAVLDSLPDCVKVLSVDGLIRFVNVPGLALMEAKGKDELLGKNYVDLWPDLGSNVLDAIAHQPRCPNGYRSTLLVTSCNRVGYN